MMKKMLEKLARSSVSQAFTIMERNQPKLPKILMKEIEDKKDKE